MAKRSLPPVFGTPAGGLVAGAAEVVVGETVAVEPAVDGPPVATLCAGEAGTAPLPHAARTTPPKPAARAARAWRRLRRIEWAVVRLDMSFTAFPLLTLGTCGNGGAGFDWTCDEVCAACAIFGGVKRRTTAGL